MTYFAKPISSREQATGVATWLWADHDGLHCGPDLPATKVPTGHLWGWGSCVWVHLREDAAAPTCGILLAEEAGPGLVQVETLPVARANYLRTVLGQERFLRCASEADAQRFAGLDLTTVVVVSPTHAVLVGSK